MRGKRNEKGKRKCGKFGLTFPFLEALYRKKSTKSKIFVDFGINCTLVPPTSHNHPIKSKTFQFVQISPFLKFFSPIIPYYNSTFTPIGSQKINRTNLHKFSINTQIYLIFSYYHLHFDLRNHVQPLKLKGLTWTS